MLTKGDLQEIDKVLTKRIKTELKPVRIEMQDGLKTVRAEMQAELKPIKSDIGQIRRDIKTIVNFFDCEYLDLRKRVERIEEHLHLSAAS